MESREKEVAIGMVQVYCELSEINFTLKEINSQNQRNGETSLGIDEEIIM